MSDHFITQISPSDLRAREQAVRLLEAEGIRLDANLDYMCGMYDSDLHMIATGSCFDNTLRCMAVSSAHRGEGLMNEIVTHLIEDRFSRGKTRLFVYTKCASAAIFRDLGFYEVARIPDRIVLLENRRNGFSAYLKKLRAETSAAADARTGRTAAIVMNANPFTLGHQYLVERACAENDLVHLFVVSEDVSLFPYAIRRRLLLEGTSHLSNIVYHETGPYMISSATFPAYFQKDEASVIESQAWLDLRIFAQIAKVLGIRTRYVGEEPASLVTGIYNTIMQKELPEEGIACIVVPRKEAGEVPVSASTVRQCLRDGDYASLRALVPESTLRWCRSREAVPVLAGIRAAGNIVHY